MRANLQKMAIKETMKMTMTAKTVKTETAKEVDKTIEMEGMPLMVPGLLTAVSSMMKTERMMKKMMKKTMKMETTPRLRGRLVHAIGLNRRCLQEERRSSRSTTLWVGLKMETPFCYPKNII